MKKQIISLITIICLAAGLFAGCGGTKVESEEKVELLEPVGIESNYYYAERRDLVISNTYAGKVIPEISEVKFNSNQTFEKYGKLPGDSVNKGDVIIYADTEGVDKSIKDLKEKIADNETAFLENLSDYNKSLEKLKGDERYYGEICDNFENMNDAEKAAYGGNGYTAEYASYSFKLANAVAQREHLEETIKEETELYNLDASHNAYLLKRMEESRGNALAKSSINGEVVSVSDLYEDDRLSKGESVAAVGDLNSLFIAIESISKSEVKRALDIYATVNGVRYEIEFVDRSLNAEDNGASYSAFTFHDPDNSIKSGDFAVITFISDKRENVLCVPNDAIVRDSDGAGVYVYEGENTVYTPVKTGLKNGFYTEIISGINEGDRISTEFTVKDFKNTAKLEKGAVSTEFSGTGYIYYSVNQWIKNPVEYGTAYVKEVLVERYERVEKGQVIAKIYVTPDSINIDRQERLVLRAMEDLQKLKDENDSEGKNDRAIKNKTEYILKIQETINDMKNDAAITEIKAPFSGIITSVNKFNEGDILQKDGKVAMIAAEDDCFIVVEDDKGQLTYGNEVVVAYEDSENKDKEVKGKVVTVSSQVLSSSLKAEYSLIKVSPEDFAEMASLNQGYDGWWMRSRFTVKANVREMSNVVLVPRKSVTLSEGITYVTVPSENGAKTYKAFISGGGDNDNYWVVEGLTEGMTICLD